MSIIYLLLGGNIGDKLFFIDSAINAIKTDVGNIITKSSIYETAPWGFEHQNSFLNQVVVAKTLLSPHQLLLKLKKIEISIGRKSQNRSKQKSTLKRIYEARKIDIDILFYDNLQINDKDLTIPHKQLHNRMFTLVPLNEIKPDLIHPVINKNISQLIEECKDTLEVVKLEI